MKTIRRISGLLLLALSLSVPAVHAETIRMAVTDLAGMEELQREFGAFRDKLSEVTGYDIEFTPVTNRTAAAEALRGGPDLPNDLLMAGSHVSDEAIERLRDGFVNHSDELINAIVNVGGTDVGKYTGMHGLDRRNHHMVATPSASLSGAVPAAILFQFRSTTL